MEAKTQAQRAVYAQNLERLQAHFTAALMAETGMGWIAARQALLRGILVDETIQRYRDAKASLDREYGKWASDEEGQP